MAAVLSPTAIMSSIDDSSIRYSVSTSADWRTKYEEVADMLAETKAELDDFHHASKELEAELEAELQRTEKAQQDLRVKIAKAEVERDDWKSKFISLQTTHNKITASLQRELDKLRQEYQTVKVQLRELEMGNDDLERTERAVSSTLADIEGKYTRALEEKILLEHELLDKANVEEQCQRLRDELRDANAEISHLKDQLTARPAVSTDNSNSSVPSLPRISASSAEDLLSTPPPPDLQLSELDPSSERLSDTPSSEDEATPRKIQSPVINKSQAALLQRAGFNPAASATSTPPSGSSIPRSRTIPSYSSPRTPTSPSKRSAVTRNPSTMSTNSTASTASKSRGVQMVSEMRARVKNLEQKIHTRVPRIRMGSISGRSNVIAEIPTLSSGSRNVLGRSSWENPLSNRRSNESKRSTDTESEKSRRTPGGDTSGWVLIMEDSPSPPKERRRASSPKKSTFQHAASTSSSPTFGSSKTGPLFQSTVNKGRPQSRLSGGSTATSTSIPTPTSRPATPTFLPLPTSSSSTMIGQKRSTGPSSGPLSYQPKRSSLGSAAAMPPGIRSGSSTPASDNGKVLPQLPDGHANVTVRSRATKPPPSNSSMLLAQSRIGRPNGTRRKSTDGSLDSSFMSEPARPRSGSAAAHR
ncbi:hypothetical protein D9757_002817 [Collybiopsis confluens]|uniref:NUDE domain-containing protein n=1 Tax=Collybiopsis confluens TaxID=2823264 RepID=A0A8H5MDX0_9AGAR|nr:hypothetical protein D9757_002817 [Collybiopsis confluens]